MKKLKNKFVIIIFVIISCIILWNLAFSNFFSGIDRNSYITLIHGKGNVNSKQLVQENKKILSIGDTVQTGEDSFAIIEWGDGSITRLGNKTEIKINDNYISEDRTIIQVMFEIVSGETWSNVLSYIPGDSYFVQVYDDTEVAVRGTIFTLNVDNDYIYVDKHKVKVTAASGEVFVDQFHAYSLNNNNEIQLHNFIKNYRNGEFFKNNKLLDEVFYKKMINYFTKEYKKEIDNAIVQLQKLESSIDKKSYDKLLSLYQKVHFLKPGELEVSFSDKLKLKEKLILNSDEINQKLLTESYFFDFIDSITSQSEIEISLMAEFIKKHKDLFNSQYIINKLIELDIQSFVDESIRNEVQRLKEDVGLGIEIGGTFIDGITYLDEQSQLKLINLKKVAEINGEVYTEYEVQRIKEDVGLGIEIGGKFIDGISKLDKKARENLYELKNKTEVIGNKFINHGYNNLSDYKNQLESDISNIILGNNVSSSKNINNKNIFSDISTGKKQLEDQAFDMINNFIKNDNEVTTISDSVYDFLEDKVSNQLNN